ncbi:MAG TPA: serine/threonine-protein kinase [Polyangiaceae bacterium]|nr:serine/threonine-protein kinase [Polyangiaceae bacterium]
MQASPLLAQGFPPPPGSVVDDKFVVSELIGSGGTGVVVAARHRALGRLVAIKFMHPELAASEEVVARFLREARAMSRLKSEHVAGVIDVGTLPDGIPYFVMEHLTGTDLESLLQMQGVLSVDQVLDYVLQALEALAEAHRAGIVHRDLKPANLLLTTREDDSDFVKVLDFGTSKLSHTEHSVSEFVTRSGSLLGSPLYMSPEQIRNASDVDARSDIWSLGVVMHELLTGQPPFQGDFLGDIIGSICSDAYAAPAREDLPAELAFILMRCLEKDPDDRFQSAEELARAFWPIIRTVASQVSIERILRMPSSAPPPHPELVVFEDPTLPRIPLTDTVGHAASVAPHEGAPRDSRTPGTRRVWLGAAASAALSAAAFATWVHLRAEPVGRAASPQPAAVLAPRATTAIAAAPAATDAVSPKIPREHATHARQHLGTLRLAASSARETNAPVASSKPAEPSATKPEFRTLDGENPFTNR